MLVNLRMQRLQDDSKTPPPNWKLPAAGFPDTPGTFAIVYTDTMPGNGWPYPGPEILCLHAASDRPRINPLKRQVRLTCL